MIELDSAVLQVLDDDLELATKKQIVRDYLNQFRVTRYRAKVGLYMVLSSEPTNTVEIDKLTGTIEITAKTVVALERALYDLNEGDGSHDTESAHRDNLQREE